MGTPISKISRSIIMLGKIVHVAMALPGLLFCAACGAYSQRRTVKLHSSCLRTPASAVVAKRLEKMASGKHPVTGAFLGCPRRVSSPIDDFLVLLPYAGEGTEEEHD